MDSIQYYHALLNTKTKKIIQLLPIDTSDDYKVDPVVFALSVDPMSDKYPNQSPYGYCGWRPINVIDPDGMDEWEINSKGETTKHIETKAHDAFYIVDDKGKRIDGKSKEFSYGKVKSHDTPTVNVKGTDTKLDIFNIKGDDNAKEVFELFANNTDKEWSHAKTGKTEGENGSNMVGTSHSNSSTAVGSYLRDSGYTLREVNHNHPSGNPIPSGIMINDPGDAKNAILYKHVNPNIKLNVYTKGYKYSPYDEHGTLDNRLLKSSFPPIK